MPKSFFQKLAESKAKATKEVKAKVPDVKKNSKKSK
jgi:hypothetical protein